MNGIATYKRTMRTISIIVLSVFLLIKCTGNEKPVSESQKKEEVERKKNFAGSASCASCHKDIYESHINTAHFRTSQPATKELIKGSFEKGQNIFAFSEKVFIAMEKRDSGYYQTAYQDGAETKHRRFDIVVGSGKKGQTYAYWMDNRLFQLPISYFTSAHQWSNSPGFPNRIVFNRPITSRCLECHATYAKKVSAPDKEPEEFSHDRMIFGVDCEKCHGPAAEHVGYHQKNPADTVGKYLINPATLSRQQKLDLCALCHGGRLNKTQPSFSFEPGDKLTDYFVFDTVGRKVADIDVHGNQFGLLSASKCFTMSQMTCESCHNPHKNESGQLQVFSSKCMNCHDGKHEQICKKTKEIGPIIKENCIDCHMPEQPSRAIAVMLQGAAIPTSATMRSHYIKNYPAESEQILRDIKKFISKSSNR